MKVYPITSSSHEKVEEEITVMVPTTRKIEVTRLVEKTEYEVTLTQEQLDVIVAICGNITGGGSVRRLTDSIWEGLVSHATKEEMSRTNRKYSFRDFFKVKESSFHECGYIITKETK